VDPQLNVLLTLFAGKMIRAKRLTALVLEHVLIESDFYLLQVVGRNYGLLLSKIKIN
jgi:hypothetical protein